MPSAVKMTLEGVPILAASVNRWTVRSGVDAVTERFHVTPAGLTKLESLMDGETPVTLETPVGSIKNLFVIREVPSDNPNVKAVLVADQRWIWPYKHILRRYNMRRRTGVVRRNPWGDTSPIKNAIRVQTRFEFDYAKYSLNPETEKFWTPKEVISDVLGGFVILDPDSGKGQVNFEEDIEKLDDLSIESLVLDDQGNNAVRRVLALIPGAELTIDVDGSIRIFSTYSGKETEIVGTGEIGESGLAGPEIVGGGHIEYVEIDAARPSSVKVRFTYECEVRFDFVTGIGGSLLGAFDHEYDDPPMILRNVMQVPDFELEIDGVLVPAGTWRSVVDILGAWNGVKLPLGHRVSRITEDLLDHAMVPGIGLWNCFEILAKEDTERAQWAARLGKLMHHYLRTFQIPQGWIDRFIRMEPYLVATLDPATGQRSPATAWGDHSIIPSVKGNYQNLGNGLGLGKLFGGSTQTGPSTFVIQVPGYPGFDEEIDKSTSMITPGQVEIVDSDQGIIRLNYNLDPYGQREIVLPGLLANPPQWDFGFDSGFDGGFAFNTRVVETGDISRIDKRAKEVAFLFTAIPSSPNSEKQLYEIEVYPEDVKDLLPEAAMRGLENANGPVQEVRVGGALETARVAWETDSRSTIKRIFGVPEGSSPVRRSEIRHLVINDALQGSIGGGAGGPEAASLPNIARAVAAAVWARHHARARGTMTGNMNMTLPLDGSLQEISHQIDQDGSMKSVFLTKEDLPMIDVLAFMDGATRQVVLNQIKPQ